jgi:HlyD family type I secretion membrane fusion protein
MTMSNARNPIPVYPEHTAPTFDAVRPHLIVTTITIALAVTGVLTWAAFAPLPGAAVAAGVVSPEIRRKTVQHKDGGVVQQIHVREGEAIAEGQAVITLEDYSLAARMNSLEVEKIQLEAAQARLQALADRRADMRLPDSFDSNHPAILSERLRFGSQQAADFARLASLDAAQRKIETELASARNELTSLELIGRLIEEELADQQYLLDRQVARRPTVLALQRTRAQNDLSQTEYRGRISRLETELVANQEERRTYTAQRLADLAQERSTVETSLARNAAERVELQGRSQRLVVQAPAPGHVVNLRVRTLGAVIAPGGDLLDIVPSDEPLAIEVQVPAREIVDVEVGRPAKIRLQSFSQREVPLLPAHVTSVSADTVNETIEANAYRVYLQMDRSALSGLPANVKIGPGLPVEAFIETRERTVLDYFLDPLRQSLGRALRER